MTANLVCRLESDWSNRRMTVGGFRAAAQRLQATSANAAPCGSMHWAIQLPPGT